MEFVPSLKCALRTLVVIAALAYVGLGVLVFLRQSSFVYCPARDIAFTPSHWNLTFDDVRLKTQDGEEIAGWYIPAENAEWTVLFFHGNGGNIGDRVEIVGALHGMGLNVLIIDYRGYGRSTGKPSEEGTYRDALAAWDYLTSTRGASPESIVVYGRSLGGAVACRLSAEKEPGALILESAFTSIRDMAAERFPYLPVRFFCRFNYDTLEDIKSVRCPVLVAHSKSDETVPYEQGRRIFEAAPEPKRFAELSTGHNIDSLEVDVVYRETFGDFLRQCVGLSKGTGEPQPH